MMDCAYCRGEMKRDAAPFHADRKGCHLTLDAVPAWVCVQCGEPHFEEKEIAAIQNLVLSIEENAKALAVTA